MKHRRAVESDDESKGLVRTTELISNFKKQVVTEERWEISSDTPDDGSTVPTADRKGVVVTLEDGQTRYLVSRSPNEQKDGVDVIVSYADRMGPDWVRVDQKAVQNVKLEDYLDQGEGVSESEEKKEPTDVHRVQKEDMGDSTKGHPSQSEDKTDSSCGHKDSEDTACKM